MASSRSAKATESLRGGIREKALSRRCELPLDQVVVTLTEGAVRFKTPDGTTRISEERFGTVRYESRAPCFKKKD
jgi:hypothetical protein